MSRLTNEVRETMARALVRHKFAAEGVALLAESGALFNAVIDVRYDEGTRKLMRQLQRREPKAFVSVSSISVNVRGMRFSVGTARVGAKGCWFSMESLERAVLNGEQYGTFASYLDGDLADRLAAFATATHKFTEVVTEAYRKALGTLSQFSTGKRLAADWPEALPVIGDFIPEDNRQLPVIQLQALNEEFDLPPEELAQAA